MISEFSNLLGKEIHVRWLQINITLAVQATYGICGYMQ